MTIYVDPVNGSDSNAGTSSASPLKDYRYAIATAIAAGDGTVVEVTSDAINPFRTFKIDPDTAGGTNNLAQSITAALRIRVPRGTVGLGAYITTAINLSDGVSRGDFLKNLSFDQFISGTEPPHYWYDPLGTGTISKETTITYNSGAASCKLDGTLATNGSAVNVGIAQTLHLPAGMTLRLSFVGRSEVAAKLLAIRIRDYVPATDTYWNFLTGAWQTSDGTGAWMRLGTTEAGQVVNTWYSFTSGSGTYAYDIVTANTGKHEIKMSPNNTGGVWYLDDFSLTSVSHPTYSWTYNGDGTYSLPVLHFNPARVLVCSASDWNADGLEAFKSLSANYALEDSLANCQANEQTAYFDSSTNNLTIHPPTGSILSDLHIEAYPLGSVVRIGDDVTCSGLGVVGAQGVNLYTGATIPTAANCYGMEAIQCAVGYITNVGIVNSYRCKSYYTPWDLGGKSITEGDFLAIGTGTMYAYGCEAHNSSDDAFQADASGTMYAYGCLAKDGGTDSTNTGGSHGFKCGETGASTGVFKYCTAINMGNGAGFYSSNNASATVTFDQCVGSGSGWKDFYILANPTVTVTDNIGGTYLASGVGGSGEFENAGNNNQSVQDADVTSVGLNSDGSLTDDSPAKNTGDALATTSLWSSGDPPWPCAIGGSFPSRKLNKGADQR